MTETKFLDYQGLSEVVSKLKQLITGADKIHVNTTASWNGRANLIGEAGHIYVYTDYEVIDGQQVPAIKIGDGKAYLIDAPFVDGNNTVLQNHIRNNDIHITAQERDFWNAKVRAIAPEADSELLTLTTD